MKKDNFGTIMYNGTMVDLNNVSLDELEKMATNLKEKEEDLKNKILTVFKQ